MKTILIVTDNLRTQVNGVVTTFKNLEKHSVADGYNIVYIDPGQFPHINALGYPEVKLSWPKKIGQKIEAINPDHIHIATEGPLGLAARLYLDRKGYRYNTSYHTKFPEFMRQLYSIPESWTYNYVRWFHKHSGKVLTTTETMVKELKYHGFQGEVIPWTRGVDRDLLKADRPCYEKSVYNSQPVVLYVGRVSEEKNLDDLCILQHEFQIRIVGDGPYLKELSQKYPAVRFLGYKHGIDLANEYACADVFCFPSKVDTFGIVMIEAMSLGTPVAAYKVAGPVDVIEEGITGHMSDDLSKSIRIAMHYDRNRVRDASMKWTWENCWNIFRDNLIPVI